MLVLRVDIAAIGQQVLQAHHVAVRRVIGGVDDQAVGGRADLAARLSIKEIDAGVPAEVLARLVVPLAERGAAGVVEHLRDPVAVGVARVEGGCTAGVADRIDPVGGRRHIAQARLLRRRSRRETVEKRWCCGEAEQERQGRGQHCFPHGASTPFPARTRRS